MVPTLNDVATEARAQSARSARNRALWTRTNQPLRMQVYRIPVQGFLGTNDAPLIGPAEGKLLDATSDLWDLSSESRDYKNQCGKSRPSPQSFLAKLNEISSSCSSSVTQSTMSLWVQHWDCSTKHVPQLINIQRASGPMRPTESVGSIHDQCDSWKVGSMI